MQQRVIDQQLLLVAYRAHQCHRWSAANAAALDVATTDAHHDQQALDERRGVNYHPLVHDARQEWALHHFQNSARRVLAHRDTPAQVQHLVALQAAKRLTTHRCRLLVLIAKTWAIHQWVVRSNEEAVQCRHQMTKLALLHHRQIERCRSRHQSRCRIPLRHDFPCRRVVSNRRSYLPFRVIHGQHPCSWFTPLVVRVPC